MIFVGGKKSRCFFSENNPRIRAFARASFATTTGVPVLLFFRIVRIRVTTKDEVDAPRCGISQNAKRAIGIGGGKCGLANRRLFSRLSLFHLARMLLSALVFSLAGKPKTSFFYAKLTGSETSFCSAPYSWYLFVSSRTICVGQDFPSKELAFAKYSAFASSADSVGWSLVLLTEITEIILAGE